MITNALLLLKKPALAAVVRKAFPDLCSPVVGERQDG
jgi:hypothetical protein